MFCFSWYLWNVFAEENLKYTLRLKKQQRNTIIKGLMPGTTMCRKQTINNKSLCWGMPLCPHIYLAESENETGKALPLYLICKARKHTIQQCILLVSTINPNR